MSLISHVGGETPSDMESLPASKSLVMMTAETRTEGASSVNANLSPRNFDLNEGIQKKIKVEDPNGLEIVNTLL